MDNVKHMNISTTTNRIRQTLFVYKMKNITRTNLTICNKGILRRDAFVHIVKIWPNLRYHKLVLFPKVESVSKLEIGQILQDVG